MAGISSVLPTLNLLRNSFWMCQAPRTHGASTQEVSERKRAQLAWWAMWLWASPWMSREFRLWLECGI